MERICRNAEHELFQASGQQRAPTAYLGEKGLVGYRNRPDCKPDWQSVVIYGLIGWYSELAFHLKVILTTAI